MREKIVYALGALAGILLVRNLIVIAALPDEVNQGMIFRIIFFHVPAAIIGMMCYFTALLGSAGFLLKKNFRLDALAVSATEVGLAFSAVNLVTGSIWGRVIWGVWWAWDARLTWALICWIMYAGYMMLRKAIEEPTQRATVAAIFSIFAFVDVPIVFFSIKWWRTQHPQPVFWGGGSFPRDWTAVMGWNLLALALLGASMVMARWRQEETQREIDALRREAHAM